MPNALESGHLTEKCNPGEGGLVASGGTPTARLGAEGRWLRLALAAGVLLLLATLSAAPPVPRLFFPCAFHAISGLPCLFCGGTRAARAILHGGFAEAIALNALAFPALFALGASALVLAIEATTGIRLIPWEKAGRLRRGAPFLAGLALAWWACHIFFALRTPKPELADFRNPLAATARDWIAKAWPPTPQR